MFASRGETTEPCGVPISVFFHSPSSIMPASSHFWISLSILGSATRCWRNFSSQLLSRLSKNPRMSASSTQAHLLPRDRDVQRIQRLMLATSWPEAVGETPKVLFINLVEDCDHSMLDDLVLQRCDPQWPLPAIGFRNIHPPGWLRSISAAVNPAVQIG